MKATKLPSGNWRVLAYIGKDIDGKDIRKSFTAPTKQAALMMAAEYAGEHRNTSIKATFGAASEAFLRSCEVQKSPSTCRGYISIDKNIKELFPRFYALPCSMITEQDIESVIRTLSTSRSPKTVTNYYFYISAVLRSKKIRINYSDILPDRKRPKLRIPTSAEVKLILDAAKAESTELWICLALASMGPLRASEISALRYRYEEDIDFEHDTIHVSHALVKDTHGHALKVPKTDSSDRYIVMPHEVMAAIEEQGYVTNYTPNGIYQRFKRICREVGIQGVRLHDLRHYCASMLHAKGYPDAYIQARTGHSTAEVLRIIYTHALDDEQQRITQAMLNDFNQLL